MKLLLAFVALAPAASLNPDSMDKLIPNVTLTSKNLKPLLSDCFDFVVNMIRSRNPKKLDTKLKAIDYRGKAAHFIKSIETALQIENQKSSNSLMDRFLAALTYTLPLIPKNEKYSQDIIIHLYWAIKKARQSKGNEKILSNAKVTVVNALKEGIYTPIEYEKITFLLRRGDDFLRYMRSKDTAMAEFFLESIETVLNIETPKKELSLMDRYLKAFTIVLSLTEDKEDAMTVIRDLKIAIQDTPQTEENNQILLDAKGAISKVRKKVH